MYWFFPSKKYDPTPFSRIKYIWHAIVSCGVHDLRISEAGDKAMFANCECGRAWELEKI